MKSFMVGRALAAAFLAIVVSACGGGGGSGDGGSGGSAPPLTPAPAPPPPAPPPLKFPIPAGLWSAPQGSAPAAGNYVMLQGGAGDYIVGDRSITYTHANALIRPTASGLKIMIGIEGNQDWRGDFTLPGAAETLQAGYFADLASTPVNNSTAGGLNWSGDGRGCSAAKGWIVIDKIELTQGVLTALDMRFEQRCDNATAPMHGQVRWTKAAADSAPLPKPAPIPANLWRAVPGSVPASGSYVYLESANGDYIGAGRTYSYSNTNSNLRITGSGARINVYVSGDEQWDGDFQGMQGMPELAVGYYSGLKRFPFNNPVLGGLSWSGEGRGCNELEGWFVIDSITYAGNVMTAVELRFEQFCGGITPLRGQLRWTASDASAPPGPQTPPPAGLWKPDPSFVPPQGNYVFLVSTPGDYIGGGLTQLLTPETSTISVVPNLTAAMQINVGGWRGDFVGMSTLSQLQPGYYGDLQRVPFHNSARGGLSWSGNGRGCNTLKGWFVVDRVSYSLGQLTAIDLRFEQFCEGGTTSQRGVIHWMK